MLATFYPILWKTSDGSGREGGVAADFGTIYSSHWFVHGRAPFTRREGGGGRARRTSAAGISSHLIRFGRAHSTRRQGGGGRGSERASAAAAAWCRRLVVQTGTSYFSISPSLRPRHFPATTTGSLGLFFLRWSAVAVEAPVGLPFSLRPAASFSAMVIWRHHPRYHVPGAVGARSAWLVSARRGSCPLGG